MSAKLLSELTNAEISEVFAVEVAGWKKRRWKNRQGYECMGWDSPCGKTNVMSPPAFADSTDAVLPYITEKGWAECIQWIHVSVPRPVMLWRVRLMVRGSFVEGVAPTFARAACIALITAKRAEKTA